MTYVIRNPPKDLWEALKDKAAKDNMPLRDAVLSAIKSYIYGTSL